MAAGMDERTAAFAMTMLIVGALLSVTDAQNYYKLQVDSVVNEIPVNSSASNITISEDLIGQTVVLSCTSTNGSLAEHAILEWMDGEVPIRQFMANRVLENSRRNTLSLVIYNFTVANYGQYRCRCVNDYSSFPPLSLEKHLTITNFGEYSYPEKCSTEVNVVNLVPAGRLVSRAVEYHGVTEVGDLRQLPCESGNWSIWKPHSVPEYVQRQHTLNLTVSKSADQTKAVCLTSSNTLEKIFYVSIKDYHQLLPKFIRPSDGAREVTLDLNDTVASILCMFQLSSAEISIQFYVSRNGGRKVTLFEEIDDDITVIVLSSRGSLRPVLLVRDFFDRTSIAANESIASEWYNSTFSCTAEGMKWEEDVETEAFTLIRPDTVEADFSAPTTTTVATTTATLVTSTPTPTPSPWLTTTSESIQLYSTAAIHSLQSSITPTPTATLVTSTPTPWLTTTSESIQLYSTAHSLQSSTVPHLSSTFTPAIAVKTSSKAPSSSLTPRQTPSPPPGSNTADTNIIVFVSAGFASLLFLATLLLCVMYVFFKKCCSLGNRHSVAGLTVKQLFLEFGITENGSQEASSAHLSVTNPLVYSKSLERCIHGLEEKQWLFPYEQLEIGEELGSGAFGLVKKAVAHNVRPDGSSITVAVKMLKENGSDEEEKDLISELKVLQHVGAHPNIVSFMGAAINQGELHLIVEFCGKGSLLHYLRSRRGDRKEPLTPKCLIAMARQVSLGMKYLASKKCIHRDLAARNVLVTDDLVLKVADFGLARKVYDSIYRPSGGRVPIKWMSPETILDREYTTQSDVWSFGILLWEIMSLGRSPYPGKSPEEVMKCIRKNYRMPAPDDCPPLCYSLMLKCWEQVPSERPSFAELCNLTEELGTQLEALEFRNYHILEETHHLKSSHSVNFLTSRDSDLCCYCTAEVGEDKYCRCSRTSLLEEEDAHMYANTEVKGTNGPKTGRQQLKITNLNGTESMQVVSDRGQSVVLPGTSTQTSLFDHHQSSSMPYLPILWSSTDYLPLMSSAHTCNAVSSGQRHNLCNGSHYDKLLSKDSATTSQHQIYQPHAMSSKQRHSLCDGSHYDKLLSKDSTSTSQHQIYQPTSVYDRLKPAKSRDSLCNSTDKEDTESPLVTPNHFSPVHELWSGGIKATHSGRPTSVTELEKTKVEFQQSNVSDDSGMDIPTSLPERQPSNHAPITDKKKVEYQESNTSNTSDDSGMDTPISLPPVHIIEKMKVEHQQSNLSNDSGIVTSASDSTSPFELWSQKSSLNEAITMEPEEDASKDPSPVARTWYKMSEWRGDPEPAPVHPGFELNKLWSP